MWENPVVHNSSVNVTRTRHAAAAVAVAAAAAAAAAVVVVRDGSIWLEFLRIAEMYHVSTYT